MHTVFVVCVSFLLAAAPPEPWAAGDIGPLEAEKMQRFSEDVANADLSVSIVNKDGRDQIDIGVDGHSFTLAELQRYFKYQRHKDFIVVNYHKNTPNGKLQDSLKELKIYFQEAGYKRILLTHGAATSIVIHEDFRPKANE